MQNDTSNEGSQTEEEKAIDTIDDSTCATDLAETLYQLNEQAKLRTPLIGELKMGLHIYRASEDHKDIVELFDATVLPPPPVDSTEPHEFKITLKDIFGEDFPICMDPKDSITFSLPLLDSVPNRPGPGGGTAKSPGRDGTAICSPSGAA